MAEISGGKKLAAALLDIAKHLDTAATLKVGFLQGATYPSGMPVAAVAAFNNFGTNRSPPRPFFTNMVKDKSPGWPAAIAANLKAYDYDAAKALGAVGLGIEKQLKEAILDTNAPALAASTVARKGHDKPLIDSSHMINSTGREVL